jgi:YggT family protein
MITSLLITLLDLFKYALFARLIIDYVQMFARNWRPNSFLIPFFELIFTVTDPPMKFVGRFVPPLRVGGVAIDLSFIVLLIAISLAQNVIAGVSRLS